tara:strand:+ start:177 stop:1553 length:1377 start_codon:yes stop_codon:yes gene_type:complete
MRRNIFILYLLGIIKGQELPYGMPRYFEIEVNQPIKRSAIQIQEGLKNHFFDEVNPITEDNQHLYYFEIILEKDDPIHFKIFDSTFHKSSTLYFIDIQNNGWVGPYTKDSFSNNDFILTGRMKTKNILVELSISKNIKPKNPLGDIIHPKKMRSSNSMIKPKSINREPNNKILLTGYWPPSNEGIRSFSQNHLLNPNGWIGGNWENRGYDIVSYFPIFTDPDCESCGQGYGDLEVDYQDTSEDWWNIIDSINPIAIITFSRGYIDYSWELEWQYFNYFYWTADFTEPFYPTPAPPDSSLPINTRRYSSLPMDSIVSQIASSGLGLTPYIDYTQGAGAYLSEFMGYHGVWHKAKMDSANIPCIVAGHVHVGGLIDWDTAQQAVAITLREVIKVVDEYQSLPGDVNQDGVLSIYDMLEIIDHILGNEILDNGQLNRADINLDTHIDVFDLLLLSNIILDW